MRGAEFVLALRPMEGADDLDGGLPAGTIFSLRPAGADPEAAFLAPGRIQAAAGFVTYGPRTLLTLTDGTTTTTRIFDPQNGSFRPPAVLRLSRAPARSGETPRGADCARKAAEAGRSLAAGAQRVLTRGGLHVVTGIPARAPGSGSSTRRRRSPSRSRRPAAHRHGQARAGDPRPCRRRPRPAHLAGHRAGPGRGGPRPRPRGGPRRRRLAALRPPRPAAGLTRVSALHPSCR